MNVYFVVIAKPKTAKLGSHCRNWKAVVNTFVLNEYIHISNLQKQSKTALEM